MNLVCFLGVKCNNNISFTTLDNFFGEGALRNPGCDSKEETLTIYGQ